MPVKLKALCYIPVREIPIYDNMTMGHYATHVLGPMLGFRVEPNGDVEILRVVMNGLPLFQANQRNHLVRNFISNGDTMHVCLRIGGPDESHSYAHGDSSEIDPSELSVSS